MLLSSVFCPAIVKPESMVKTFEAAVFALSPVMTRQSDSLGVTLPVGRALTPPPCALPVEDRNGEAWAPEKALKVIEAKTPLRESCTVWPVPTEVGTHQRKRL